MPPLSANYITAPQAPFESPLTEGISHNCSLQKTVSTHSSKNKKNRTVKKGVSFNKQVRMRLSFHVNDYTNEEIDACWYRGTELRQIKRNALLEINALSTSDISNIQDTEDFCLRGLEGRLSGVVEKRRQQRFLAIDTVLFTQYQQDEDDTHDAEQIAFLYQQITASDADKALAIGLRDSLSVLDNV